VKATTKQRLAEALQRDDCRDARGVPLVACVARYARCSEATVYAYLSDSHRSAPNVHRAARATVHAAASGGKWWANARASLGKWRLFWAKLFPRLARRYDDAVGRWYKRTTKAAAKRLIADMRDGTLAEHARLERHAEHLRRKELYAKRRAELKSYHEEA
jgi:hypothetical protein